jgi:UDP-N-acetylmuramate dehydrogenase
LKSIIDILPKTRGRYRANADLSKSNWFGVGGVAEVLFKPEDAEDLADFLRGKPADVPITIIGVGSNLIVRDGGIKGVVIRLGRGFVETGIRNQESGEIHAGAACLDIHVAELAADYGLTGLEFLSGIPGTIGGALRMNGGAYGSDISQVLVEAEAIDAQGNFHRLKPADLQYTYRHCGAPEDWIFTRCILRGKAGDKAEIAARMAEIKTQREASQPVRSRTGGSTFKNPEGHKAWALIDSAGCRGLRMGDAQVSELHCNFLINHGNATAAELEALGEEVKRRVRQHSGVELEWEIKRIGEVA